MVVASFQDKRQFAYCPVSVIVHILDVCVRQNVAGIMQKPQLLNEVVAVKIYEPPIRQRSDCT